MFPVQLSHLLINDLHSSHPQPRMVSPEQHTRRSRIATKTSRRLSARSKSLLSYSMTYPPSSCNPRFLSLRLILQMSVLVARQDESIDYIQNTAFDIEQDASKGYVSFQKRILSSSLTSSPRVGATDKAVASARAARKKRWICFGLFVLLLIIIAAVVAGVVVSNNNK